MSLREKALIGITIVSAVALAGCQLDAEHESTVLGVVGSGAVDTSGEIGLTSADGLSAALLWYNGRGGTTVAASVSIDGDFPAAFSLTTEGPPPAAMIEERSAFVDNGEEHAQVAIARVVGLRDPNGPTEYPNIAARSLSHVLVYVDRDLVDGGFWAHHFGTPLAAGYHLYAITLRSDVELEEHGKCLEGNDPASCGDGLDSAELAPNDSIVSVELIDPFGRAPNLEL